MIAEARLRGLIDQLDREMWTFRCEVSGHPEPWRGGDCDGHTFGVYRADGTPLVTGAASADVADYLRLVSPAQLAALFEDRDALRMRLYRLGAL